MFDSNNKYKSIHTFDKPLDLSRKEKSEIIKSKILAIKYFEKHTDMLNKIAVILGKFHNSELYVEFHNGEFSVIDETGYTLLFLNEIINDID